ncbi:MAG: restriction endonuclease subunit S [Cyclobacteriaceae bacterium]|nr:restriction endonuclease subunit S [Cyclobacteriaceae bacterium]
MSEVLEKRILSIDKSDWTPIKLFNLAEEISERADNPGQSEYDRFVGLELFVSGDLKIKNWGSTKDLGSSMKVFKSGDILFARRNAYLRRASLVEFDGICSGDAFVLRENHEKIVPGFLAFVLNSDALWDYANSNAAGTMSKRVKWRDLGEYDFLLPPIDQQARLAELLWAADDVIQSYERSYSKLAELRKNNFISKTDRATEAVHGKNSVIRKINEISKVVRGASPRPSGSPKYFNGSFLPWVTVGMLTNHESPYLEKKDIQTYLTEEGAKHTRIIPPNTVLLSNSGFSLGVPRILQFEAGANDGVAAFLELRDVKEEFLYYFLDSKTEVFRNEIAAGADQPNLNTERIGNILIHVLPNETQEQIVMEMSTIDKTIKEVRTSISASKQLQKSLINQIF